MRYPSHAHGRLPYTYGALAILLQNQVQRPSPRYRLRYEQAYNPYIARLTTVISGTLRATRTPFTLVVDTTDRETIFTLYDQNDKVYWSRPYNPMMIT